MPTIAIRRPVPTDRPAWTKDKRCRVLAGCYETEPPNVREVYVPEQIGVIQGWRFDGWEGKWPVAVIMFVDVTE